MYRLDYKKFFCGFLRDFCADFLEKIEKLGDFCGGVRKVLGSRLCVVVYTLFHFYCFHHERKLGLGTGKMS